jgi:LmbE family N-acetylglucosaminyl deacetylase
VAFTIVSFHAHPDDEALLTAGTLARAASEGHRVVLVVATSGEAGLAATSARDGGLGPVRERELRESARVLGCARVVLLGYPDSGPAGDSPSAFARLDPELPAVRLAALLREEGADLLTVYDAAGGYGHPDHVQVHRVGTRAAELAGTPAVLEATVPREPLRRVARLLARLPGTGPVPDASVFDRAYTPRHGLTHRVDVRRHLAAKRSSMAAHASQATADEGVRTLRLLLRLPRPLFRLALGHEWFVQQGMEAPGRPLDDVFAALR